MKYPLIALISAALSTSSYSAPLPQDASAPKEAASPKLGDKADNWNIHLYDKSRLEAEYLGVLRDRDQRSYEYLFSALEALHGGFRELSEPLHTLQQLSDDSLTGRVSVQAFFAESRAFTKAVGFLEDRLTSLGLFPSLNQEAKAELSGKMDLEPLKVHYQQQLQRLNERVSLMRFRLTLPSGAIFEQVGLDAEKLRGMQLITADEINEMRKQVLKKKVMSTEDQNIIDHSINAFTRKALEDYVDVFGSSERYRTSSDKAGRVNAAAALRDAFWARFYIRANYGIKIGSIPVSYHKRIFNADYLLSNVGIGAVTVWDENNLVRALNLATEAQATLHSKGARTSTSMLRNFMVWIGGSKAAEASKQFIIGLVKMDLEQELALSKSGGLRKVRAAYREHFFTSEKEKDHYQKKANTVFGPADDDDLEADVNNIGPGTLKGAIELCVSVLEQMEVRLDEARKLQDSLELLGKDNAVAIKRKKRALL